MDLLSHLVSLRFYLGLSKVSTKEGNKSSKIFSAYFELIELPNCHKPLEQVENLNLISFFRGHFSFFSKFDCLIFD